MIRLYNPVSGETRLFGRAAYHLADKLLRYGWKKISVAEYLALHQSPEVVNESSLRFRPDRRRFYRRDPV